MSYKAAESDDYLRPGILDIALKSDKPLKSVEVKILTADGYPVFAEKRTPDLRQTTFRAPREQPLVSGMSLQVEYSQQVLSINKDTIIITEEDLLSAYKMDGGDKQVWRKSYGTVEILVELENPFRPTTDRILEVCPQFRILVMGKSGVGKSSLINKVFGITEALESDSVPGEADIDREFRSDKNPQLLLHDSRGFEPGEGGNFQAVQDFIKRRERETEIKKKLHAIWLCVQAPSLGGRMIETGVEAFLNLKKDGKLGKVPIVVVFTKYDKIVTAARLNMKKAGVNSTFEEARQIADSKLQEECFVPFVNNVGDDIPYLPVSVKPEYTNTLNDLVKITIENVANYIADAAVVGGISQRINAQVKIRISIEVGKRRHWKQLTSNRALPITLEKFFDTIHQDIIKVWNLRDDTNSLSGPEFKIRILSLIDASKNNAEKTNTASSPKILGAVKGIVTALAGPVGPIMVPIYILAVNWVNDRFHKTPENLRRVMIYIVNLTIVMQNLFWIQSTLATKPRQGENVASGEAAFPIGPRLIKLALRLYIGAPDREVILTEIDRHAAEIGSFLHSVTESKYNKALDKVIDLITRSTIDTQDAVEQQSGVKFNGTWENNDESWDTTTE